MLNSIELIAHAVESAIGAHAGERQSVGLATTHEAAISGHRAQVAGRIHGMLGARVEIFGQAIRVAERGHAPPDRSLDLSFRSSNLGSDIRVAAAGENRMSARM